MWAARAHLAETEPLLLDSYQIVESTTQRELVVTNILNVMRMIGGQVFVSFCCLGPGFRHRKQKQNDETLTLHRIPRLC
jgi:hypothetical protein